MATDYRPRKPVGKNKPRKQQGKSLAGMLLGMAAAGYLTGVVSGWFFFHSSGPPITIKQEQAPPPLPVGPRQPGGESAKAGEAPPPLSFYNTLPKGSRAVLGSGLNDPAAGVPTLHAPPPAPPVAAAKAPQQGVTPPAQQPAATTPPPPAVKPSQKAPSPAAPPPAPAGQPPQTAPKRPTYTVQVASCQTRKEADEIKNRLAQAGMSPYILEATLPGKGTWYRVRVGKGLNQAQAMDMATKAGPRAEAVPEQTKSP